MSDERRRILAMLTEGKISVDEAERLLDALARADEKPGRDQQAAERQVGAEKGKPKYLRIQVEPKAGSGKAHKHVNIRIPLFILRTGLKFGSVIPEEAKLKIQSALGEKGIDVGNLDEASFDELVKGLTEMNIEVDDEDEHVRIRCE